MQLGLSFRMIRCAREFGLPLLVGVSCARTFAYDFENRVKSMNGGAVTLLYDGDGNRVVKAVGGVTTRYLVDDLNPTGYAQVVDELVGVMVARRYTYGHQRISQMQFLNSIWQTSFYGYDGLGSVRLLTDAAGTVTDTYDYDAWGNALNVTGSTPNLYLYRGEQYDPDLNLYYLRARYFNPLTGRFLTRDPAEGTIVDPQTLHKYLYAGGDPVNAIDPTGRPNWFNYHSLVQRVVAVVAVSLVMYEIVACVWEEVNKIMEVGSDSVIRAYYPSYGCLYHEHPERQEIILP